MHPLYQPLHSTDRRQPSVTPFDHEQDIADSSDLWAELDVPPHAGAQVLPKDTKNGVPIRRVEPGTFQSEIWCSTHWATEPPLYIYGGGGGRYVPKQVSYFTVPCAKTLTYVEAVLTKVITHNQDTKSTLNLYKWLDSFHIILNDLEYYDHLIVKWIYTI